MKIYIIKKIHGKDVVLRQLIINQKGIEVIVLKMSDIQKKLDHINITQLIEKELKGIYGKKIKDITKQENEKYKTFCMAIPVFTLLKILL